MGQPTHWDAMEAPGAAVVKPAAQMPVQIELPALPDHVPRGQGRQPDALRAEP